MNTPKYTLTCIEPSRCGSDFWIGYRDKQSRFFSGSVSADLQRHNLPEDLLPQIIITSEMHDKRARREAAYAKWLVLEAACKRAALEAGIDLNDIELSATIDGETY